MLVKLNNKPIDVVEDNEKEKGFSPVYFTVSCVGYGLVLFIMDMVCYTFFYIHPFPYLVWLFKLIGGVLAWL
jgi:hypothetical protein